MDYDTYSASSNTVALHLTPTPLQANEMAVHEISPLVPYSTVLPPSTVLFLTSAVVSQVAAHPILLRVNQSASPIVLGQHSIPP
jgi:hypothetical protein